MTTLLRTCCFTLLIFSAASHAWNLDGYRQGFIASLGFGIQNTSLDFDSGNNLKYASNGRTLSYKSSFSEFGVAANAKIGYGFLDQLAWQYVFYSAWYKSAENIAVFSHKSDIFNGIHALGLTYYFSKDAPSFYIMAAAGRAQMQTPFTGKPKKDGGDVSRSGSGKGVVLALGWEVANQHSIEFAGMHNYFKDLQSNSGKTDIITTSFFLTYNYHFY